MDKIGITVIVEDAAQERFISGIIKRILSESSFCEEEYEVETLSNRGGKSLQELKVLVSDLKQGKRRIPDILVVGSDANCSGYNKRKKQIEDITRKLPYGKVIPAIPVPHIERWYLIDQNALKVSVDPKISVELPKAKCEKGYYKEILKSLFRSVGIRPPLGGSEYGELIAERVDLYECGKLDHGFKLLVDQMRQALAAWKKSSK